MHGRLARASVRDGILHVPFETGVGTECLLMWVCSQEAGKGDWARGRILQMSRQMIEECRENKYLDKRSIAVRPRYTAHDGLPPSTCC